MKTISATLLGAPLDPFSNQTRQHTALVAFLAWIGLGDGLSSSCEKRGVESERGTIRRHSRGRAGERSGPVVPAQTGFEAN